MLMRPTHDIYIGTRAVACSAGGGAGWHAQADGLDDALAQLGTRLGAGFGITRRLLRPAVRLWLSGGLCRPCLLQPPVGLSGEAEFDHFARAMAPAAAGLIGPCRVWCDATLAPEAGPPAARLVIAVSQPVLDRCLAVMSGARVRPVSVMPWWAGVLNASLRSAQAAKVELLGVRDCDSLTVLAGTAGVFAQASTLGPWAGVAGVAGAESAWRRASVTSEAAPGRVLCVHFSPTSVAQNLADGAASKGGLMRWSQVRA